MTVEKKPKRGRPNVDPLEKVAQIRVNFKEKNRGKVVEAIARIEKKYR